MGGHSRAKQRMYGPLVRAEDTERGIQMAKLWEDSYPNNDEGWARMRLANVATQIGARQGLALDADKRMHLVIEMHKIERDDLPEDKLPLYDELRAYLEMA